MKKLKLTKVIANTLILASVLALNSIGASASWRKDSNGWWNTEVGSRSVGWRNINNKLYHFNNNGYMEHNKIVDNYYINQSGQAFALNIDENAFIKIPSNWQKLNTKFDSSTTHGYIIDNNSVLIYNLEDYESGTENDFINTFKEELAKDTINLQVHSKVYNGINTTCFEGIKYVDNSVNKEFVVLFFDINTNKTQCFYLASNVSSFDNAKQQLEDMLNLTLTL